ncbi:hypothetical protein Y032_0020g91 [Ancylostoma ceylanicum]|uniref:Uncharacterized protein n=1 Tax=Ancylostoma ceylanicum TaxID=53326 RepID=A0A016V1D5_9BILA|nr:hypothetical protein Y032_0020g91 [Ancylostoma ceylanicum]
MDLYSISTKPFGCSILQRLHRHWVTRLAQQLISAAAYAEDPNPCLRQHNASMVYRITLPCDYIKDELLLCMCLLSSAGDMWQCAMVGS